MRYFFCLFMTIYAILRLLQILRNFMIFYDFMTHRMPIGNVIMI